MVLQDRLIIAGATCFLALCGAVLAGVDSADHAGDVLLFKSARLRSLEDKPLEVLPGMALRASGSDKLDVPAIIAISHYDCDLVQLAGAAGLRNIRKAELKCYEITTTGRQESFRWSMWTWASPQLAHFRLVKGTGETPYLAWSEGTGARFTELTGPRNPVEALGAFLQGLEAEVQRVPVLRLVPEGSWGANAFFFDILVESIVKTADGKTIVKVKDGETAKVYTLVSDGKEWRRED